MTWLTWRQLRASAAIAAFCLVTVVAVLVLTGPRLSDLLTTAGDTFFDQFDQDTTLDAVHFLTSRLVWAVPVLVGVFWGAPMVARELEAGTHRLVWTQSISRTRWLATKLAVTGLAAAIVGLLGLALTWWCRPLDRAVADGLEGRGMASVPRLWPEVFGSRGLVPVGMAVLALAIGVAAGLILRRTVPAMALTLVAVVVVQLATPVLLQPHLLDAQRTSVVYTVDAITELQIQGRPGSDDFTVVEFAVGLDEPGAWIVDLDMVDSAGHVVSTFPDWLADCAPHPGSDPDVVAACFDRLEDEGFRQRADYLPASRFWALQALETAVLLLMAAAVAGFCFWRIRRDLT